MNDGPFDAIVLWASGGGHFRLEALFLNSSMAALFVRSKRPLQSRMDRGSCIVGRVQCEICCLPCCPVSRQLSGIAP